MYNPKYSLFFDNHTMPYCPDVGADFNVEQFVERICKCGVDFVTFHARCNMGMAYYNTEIGTKHPSLKYDLFGKISDVCQQKGIALSAYFNAGISQAEGVQHRDWTTQYFDGAQLNKPLEHPFCRTMCYNSPYGKHLVEMTREVAEKYPVAGFFYDCMNPFPCVCPHCISEMKERGIDWQNEQAVVEFALFSSQRLARKLSKTLKAINPEYLIYFNGLFYEDQDEIGTYLECECIPSRQCWGYEFLPIMARYMRTLGKPVLNMTGRFYAWGDFGGLRPENAVKSEVLCGLANGLRPNIGDHMHPRGDLYHPVFDMVEKVYGEVSAMEPWFHEAVPTVDMALVYPKPVKKIRYDAEVRGAARILSELKQQFDVVSEFSDWSNYQVLVIPDSVRFSPETARRVKAHIAAGKTVISSGTSGLAPEQTHFVLEKEWGIVFKGINSDEPAYIKVNNEFNRDIPDMPLSLYSQGIAVEVLNGTEIAAKLVKPYYLSHWDGTYPCYYCPPDKMTEQAALTVNGKVAHFSHAIFSGYHKMGSVQIRRLFSNILDHLFPCQLLKAENLPSFARATVSRQGMRKIVHILTFVPELRGKTEMIEDSVLIENVKISLRCDSSDIKQIYLAPMCEQLEFTIENNYVSVTVPRINGYSMIVFE
jgi:hypothetical protein